MKTSSKEPGRISKNMGLLGIGLCVLCCALPIIGIAGGAGILAAISMYAEKIALVLLILSAALFAIWLYRKKNAPACSIDCECKTEHAKSKTVTELNSK